MALISVKDLKAAIAIMRQILERLDEIYAGFLKLLDNNLEALKKHPARHPREKFIQPKNIFHALVIRLKHLYSGRNPNYPLPWTVFGNIFHPVVYEYREHVSYNLPVNKIKNAGIYHR